MHRTLSCLSLVVPALVGLGACSSDASPPPNYSTGMDQGQYLNALTPTQSSTICTSQAAFLRANIDTTSLTRFWCAFTPAVLSAENTSACQTALESCVNTFSVHLDLTVTDPNAPPPVCAQVNTTNCTGTIGQYEDCVNSVAHVELSVGSNSECGTQLQNPASPTVGVDACKALGSSCNAVIGTGQNIM